MATTMNLSDAIRQALSDHAGEVTPDISQRLMQIASLADERRHGSTAQRAAAELAKVGKAEREAFREGDALSPTDRARLAKATRGLQERYLAEVSPGGHAAYAAARERAAAGML